MMKQNNLFFTLLLIYFSWCTLTAQSDSLQCNGDLIVSHESNFFILQPDFQATTFNRSAFEITPPQLSGIYEAIAYRKSDNCIYGIDYTVGPYTLLFKIDPSGNRIVLDTLINTLNYYFGITAGAITLDQRYLILIRNMYTETGVVIGTGGEIDPTQANLIYLVDLESPDYDYTVLEAETTGTNAGVRIGDLAIDPTTGLGYAYDFFTERIVTIDPFTGLIDNTSFPQISFPNEQLDALMFTPFGKLVGHDKELEGETMVYLDKESGTISSLLYVDAPPNAIGNIDGCSCPYTVAIEQTLEPDTTFTCQSFEVVCSIAFWIESVQNDLVFKDSFPAGFTIEEVLYNPFGGTVLGLGTSELKIEDFTPIIGIDSLVLRVTVSGDVPSGTYHSQAALLGLDLQAANDGRTAIYSDYPPSEKKEDPTPIHIINWRNFITTNAYEICPDSSVLLQPIPLADHQDFNFSWFDGSTEPEIEISSPGTYPVTISDNCVDTTINIRITDAAIDLDLGADLEIETGGSIELMPEISSSSAITSYNWMVSDTATISCLDCDMPTLSPTEDVTSVVLMIQNESGCTATDELLVKLLRSVFAPNAFSPNFDGINDYFYLQTPAPVSIKELQVFNRWGGLVYQKSDLMTNDRQVGWDGHAGQKPAESGVYVWQATLIYDGMIEYQISGDVVLVK